jgi:hypothetical protein
MTEPKFPLPVNVFSRPQYFERNLSGGDSYTKSEILKLLRVKADITSVYKKEEVNDLFTSLELKINASLVNFITESEVDAKIFTSYAEITSYLNLNYYASSQLYTKFEIDSLLQTVELGEDLITKNPLNSEKNTINPGSNPAVPLTLVASSSQNEDTIQRWVDDQSNSIGRIRKSGRIEFYGHMQLGEVIESWRPALDVNNRRISGVSTPIHALDAVNKLYVENYIIAALEDIQREEGQVFTLDGLIY